MRTNSGNDFPSTICGFSGVADFVRNRTSSDKPRNSVVAPNARSVAPGLTFLTRRGCERPIPAKFGQFMVKNSGFPKILSKKTLQ